MQCEQTKGNVGCDKVGVCGKTPQVALMQDLLIFQLKVSSEGRRHAASQPGMLALPCSKVHAAASAPRTAAAQSAACVSMGPVLTRCCCCWWCCCLVLRLLQGLGAWASFAHQVTNLPTPEVDSFVKAAIFATLTNVSAPPPLHQQSCCCHPC